MNKYAIQRNTYRTAMFAILSGSVLLTACQSNADNYLDESPPGISEIELTADKIDIWWDQSSGIPSGIFADEHLEKQFKDTAFQFNEFHTPFYFANPGKEDLFVKLKSEDSPDLIVFNSRFLPLLLELNYLDPIFIKKEDNLDIHESALADIRAFAPDHELYALPLGQNVTGLFYNKTIFDEMNASYPTDGMTWEDVAVLAESVANPEKWSAIDVADYDLVASQLPLRLYDPETQQVDFESDAWAEMERFVKTLNGLQSEEKRDGVPASSSRMSAFASGRTAMVAGSLYDDTQLKKGFYNQESNLTLNHVEWDVVSYPVFNDDKLLAPAKQPLYIGVPRAGVNKEEAYKVMMYLLSEEVQADNMRKGLASLRTNSVSYVEQFGESSSLLSGKSTASFFKTTQAGAFDPSFDDYSISQSLHGLVDLHAYMLDDFLVFEKEVISKNISNYLNKRTQFIDQMKAKTGEKEEIE